MKKPTLPRLGEALRTLRKKHQARHSPTGFDIALADRIALLDGARWDQAAAAGGFHLRRDYLALLERHGPEQITPCYALVARGDEPVAAVAAQWLDFHGDRLGRSAPPAASAPNAANGAAPANAAKKDTKERVPLGKRLLQPLARKALDRVRQRVLVCGNLLSWGNHGVSFAPGVDPAEAWPAVGEALYRLRRAAKLEGQADFVVVKDVTAAEAPHFAPMELLGYRRVATEPDMVLDLPPAWRSFDDYLTALGSKYRKAGKRIRDDVAGGGFTLTPLPWRDVPQHAARLQQLYEQVHGNAPIRLATLQAPFWPAFAACAGEALRTTVVRRGEQLVGFVNTLRDGDTAIGYQIGFDRSAATEAPIYLRLLQATIENALQFGCRRLSLGRTALEPKARLGAQPQPIELWLRHRIPALNMLVKGLVGHVHHDEAPDRNPFG